MSKLTREVKYLSESDRPKKVEAKKFSEWSGYRLYNSTEKLDDDIKAYLAYKEEFTADEKAVEFTKYLNPESGKSKPIREVSEFNDVTYLGYDKYNGGVFSVKENDNILIYFGNLNSGKY